MIRPATHEDIPRLVEMGAQFIDDVYPAAIAFEAGTLASLAARLIDGLGIVFVFESAGEVSGMMALIVVAHPMSGERIATEMAWWVDPAARGGSAALRMLAEAERWSRAQGAQRLQMTAPSDKVCQFYEKIGFQRVEVAYSRTL